MNGGRSFFSGLSESNSKSKRRSLVSARDDNVCCWGSGSGGQCVLLEGGLGMTMFFLNGIRAAD
jgi:hypothetical protein